MTAHKACWIECDVCGEQEPRQGREGTGTIAGVRATARHTGWRQRSGGRDICAACRTDQLRRKGPQRGRYR
jgi:hypothetical protein